MIAFPRRLAHGKGARLALEGAAGGGAAAAHPGSIVNHTDTRLLARSPNPPEFNSRVGRVWG